MMTVLLSRSPSEQSSLPKDAERSSRAPNSQKERGHRQFALEKYRELTYVDHILDAVSALTGYFLGFTMGWITGWFLGSYAAQIYSRHFRVGASVYPHLDCDWTLLTTAVGEVGAVTGSVLGMVIVLIVDRVMLRRHVASLSRKNVMTPEDVSRVIGKDPRHVRKMMAAIVRTRKVNL